MAYIEIVTRIHSKSSHHKEKVLFPFFFSFYLCQKMLAEPMLLIISPYIYISLSIYTEAEASILWPLNGKSWFIGRHPDAGKDWGQEEKGVTKDDMVGWHHRLNGHEFEQTPKRLWRTEKPGTLQPTGCKESEMTYRLNNYYIYQTIVVYALNLYSNVRQPSLKAGKKKWKETYQCEDK